jgi:phosphoribosylformimino-5-aminoimidazole carboxamide ribotide isomerase
VAQLDCRRRAGLNAALDNLKISPILNTVHVVDGMTMKLDGLVVDSMSNAMERSSSHFTVLRIVPVLDLLNGVVVRGVGGRREEYRPIESLLTKSTKPLDVAIAFREQLGLTTLYVADLDGIVRRQPNWQTLRELSATGFDIWVDAGVRETRDAVAMLNAGASKIIAGLESLSGPLLLKSLIDDVTAERIIFSLDLNAGRPMTDEAANWPADSALEIARFAINAGVTQMIVLDLVSGPSTLDLCDEIRRLAPQLKLITGGGVRGSADLQLLRSRAIDGVLVSTALHNGAISRAQCVAEND